VTADGGVTTVLNSVVVPDAELIEPTIFCAGLRWTRRHDLRRRRRLPDRCEDHPGPHRGPHRASGAAVDAHGTGVAARNDEVYVLGAAS
jgi:hypothetical protein